MSPRPGVPGSPCLRLLPRPRLCPCRGSQPRSAGTCLRLYSEPFYEQRLPPSPAPHVSETSLSRLVLLLKRLDIADMGQCDFLDRPGSVRGAGGWLWLSLQPGVPLGRGWGSHGCGGSGAGLPTPGTWVTSRPSP